MFRGFVPPSVGLRRRRACIEAMEPRRLFAAYLVDSQAALAAINNTDLNPGDIVMFKGGTSFTGGLLLDANDSGTADNPVIITSYDSKTKKRLTDSAKEKSRATLKPGNGSAVYAYNTSGIVIEQLNLVGAGVKKNTGSGVTYYAETAATDIVIRKVNASGFGQAGVQVGAWNGGSVRNVRVENVKAYDNVDGITTYSQSLDLSNVYVGYSHAYDNDGRANNPDPTGSGILIGGADGAIVEFCEAEDNGSDASGQVGLGIWAYDSNNVLFQYNESHHNESKAGDGGGFDFDGGVTNSVMQFNYSHDNYGAGYGLYQYLDAPAWNNNVIRNNVSVNDGKKNKLAGIHIWSASTSDRLGRAEIYGNQIVNPRGQYLELSRPDVIEELIAYGNVFKKKGAVDLDGIGLDGPEN